MPKWTAEQSRAIGETGDILVSAGAGSGKTAVLTERIVRLVREGLDVRELLCVTFTTAAANEMKKRIERALFLAAAASQDEAESARLNEAARGCAAASISTLHAFCTQVLRRHFNEAGLDPAFRVADESETALMRDEVWDELCEARLSGGDGSFARLIEAMGSDATAFDAVSDLYDFCRSQPDPFGFLERAQRKYEADADALEASAEAAVLIGRTRRNLLARLAALAAQRDALARECPGVAAFLDGELLHARMIAMQKSPSALREALATRPHAQGARISWKGCPDALRQSAEAARDALKAALKKEAEQWSRGMEYEARLIAKQAPLIAELCAAVRDFSDRFSALKRDKSVIDYGDMEQMSLALLQKPEIAREYRERFRYVFMDEYQDCNAVQEEILRAVANPGALFLVGDVKQSIYRFRLAEPQLFIRRYGDYARPENGCRIDLNANFRSAPGVIDAVNGVFSRLMSEEAAELAYDEGARLVHGREEHEECASLPAAEFVFADMLGDWPVEEESAEPDVPTDEFGAEEEADGDDPGEPAQPRGVAQAEAVLAARRIRAIMESGAVFDPRTGEARKPRYSDFAVLLRSYKNAAEDWLTALSLEGIPAYGELSGGFFDAVEVRVFMELLRVIDNRLQDIPMAAVLRSPIGGFSTDDLIELRALGRELCPEGPWRCFDSIRAVSLCDTELGSRAAAFLDKLDRWQRMADRMSVQSLIGKLLDETDYALFCRALPGGRRREANLDALCEKARLFEATGSAGLHAFLTYTDRLRAIGAAGAPQSVGLDVVRVMSIHASKGLEFPFVLLGGLSRRFNIDFSRKTLVFDPELGLAARFRMAGMRTQSLYARAITALCEKKGVAEEMRVLYVAMTRAREKLVLLCATPRGDRLVEKAAQPQSAASVSLETSFAGWLLGCILHAKEGEALRARYGLPPLPDPAPVGIRVMAELCPQSAADGARMSEAAYERFRREALSLAPDATLFERAYGYCADTEVPSKVSVTGLAGHEITMAEAPDFLLAKRMTPADRGTAYHALMQRIALGEHDEKSVEAELSRLTDAGLLSPLQAQAVRPDEIAAFFRSALGRRLAAAERVRRELEFNIGMDARALGLGDTDAPVILQGVIDCCFMESGAWVLVDYKTDAVPAGADAGEAAARHARQVNLYAQALERLTGVPVRESYIYLFGIGQAVEIRKGD
jgi:ATP-dependent helicase/nuclease subunit A